jgi:DNA-binding NarL/FixJ family response regulator
MALNVQRSTRVVIVDDHRMFAEALEMLLSGEPELEVVGSVRTGEDAVELVRRVRPHLALVDADLPGMDGIATTRRLREVDPEVRVVLVTASQESELVARAVQAGASGCFAKSHTAESLVDIIRRAAAGELVLPTDAIRSVVGRLQAAHEARSEAERLLAQLTGREIQTLQLIAEGLSTHEIARALLISPLTVQTHVKNILAKLEVHSKLEAVSLAVRNRLIALGRTAPYRQSS